MEEKAAEAENNKEVMGNKSVAQHFVPFTGFGTIFNRENHLLRRILWALVLAAVYVGAFIQVYNTVNEYLDRETHEHNNPMNGSLPFPVVTLCNRNVFNMSRMKELKLAKAKQEDAIDPKSNNKRSRDLRNKCYNTNQPAPPRCWDIGELIGYNGMLDVKEVWDALAHNPDKMIEECTFGGADILCNQVGHWWPVYTYKGKCYSFKLYDNYIRSSSKKLHLHLHHNSKEDKSYDGTNNNNGWRVVIHCGADSIGLFNSREIDNQHTLEDGNMKDLSLYFKQYQSTNTRKKPCNENDNAESYSKCIERCFLKEASGGMTCRLPYMDSNGLDYCNTPESYNLNAKIVDNFYDRSINQDKVMYNRWKTNNCSHCLPLCNQRKYISTEIDQEKDSNHGGFNQFSVYFPNLRYYKVTDHSNRDIYSVFSDIGGSLGGLLGFSLLTAFELVDAIIKSFLNA